jgi:hypothetical protein
MPWPVSGGLLRIRHDQHDLEFISGRISSETNGAWCLRVQATGEAAEYVEHLVRGAPMTLTLVSRGGDTFAGEACVASVSPSDGGPTLVVLSGLGPLLPQ